MKKLIWIFALLTAVLMCCGVFAAAEGYHDGVYGAEATGFGGPVTVILEIRDGRIVSVDAYGVHETQGIGSIAMEQLPEAIIAADGTGVDVVSGATLTSKGILEAANKCIEQAKTDASDSVQPVRIPGDASGDGQTDIFDALAILQYAVGWDTDLNPDAGDVNDDGKCDIFDALLILQYSVGWDVELK